MESFGVITFIFCVVLICLIFDFDKDRLSLTEADNSRKHILRNIFKNEMISMMIFLLQA